MSDAISIRLAAISGKDPRSRTDADMAFLKWCTSGGQGPPPPEEPGPTIKNVPQKRSAPPKPTAQQLQQTFQAIAAKPANQRTEQENQFLLGIQEMYKHRKNMTVRNHQNAVPQQQQQQQQQQQNQPMPAFTDEPKPPPALMAFAQRKAQLQANRRTQQKQQQEEYVTKSDEPDSNLNGLGSPSNFRPLDTPPSKPPKHAIPAKPMPRPTPSNNNNPSTYISPTQDVSSSPSNPPLLLAKKKLVTEEERQNAEKALKSAMSRRLGDNMMSSLATKDLQARLLKAIQCGVDSQVITRAKKLLISVRKKKMNDQHVGKKKSKKEVNASKYSGYHAVAVSNDIEQEWSSKHMHLIEEAEKRTKLLNDRRREEEESMLLETDQGKEEFFDMMHGTITSTTTSTTTAIVPAPKPSYVPATDETDEMTEKEAEEYMFGTSGMPNFSTDKDAFDGPPSTPPMTNMPSPEKKDLDDWRKIPKFLPRKNDSDESEKKDSPYRSVLQLAASSRYSSPKHTEKSAERELGVTATQEALKLLDELGDDDEGGDENNQKKMSKLAGIDDDLPAFMLLEDCWNSVQLARDTIDKINNKSPDDKKKKKNGTIGSSIIKKVSPLDKYKPKKRSTSSNFRRATAEDEERLEYSPWNNRTSGGYIGMREDAKAMAIKEEFDMKVRNWKNEKSVEDRDAKERGQFADYMTQMFLAQKLDPLPRTDLIRKIRKEVYDEIEKIDDAYGFMPKDGENERNLSFDDEQGVDSESMMTSTGKENTTICSSSDSSDSSSNTKVVQKAKNGLPWSCKVCSKKNEGTTNKCIVCGRLQSSGPIKTSKFMSLKVKGEKPPPSSTTMTRSQRLDAAASRATKLPAGSARNAINNRKKNKKKPATFGGRYNASSSLIGSNRRAVGTHAPIDTINGML
jgi:hypothetical protein